MEDKFWQFRIFNPTISSANNCLPNPIDWNRMPLYQ